MDSEVTYVIGFLNTLSLNSGTDVIANPPQLQEWLRRGDLDWTQSPSIQDVVRATEFREALRDLVSGNSGGIPSVTSIEIVNRAARAASLSFRFHQGGSATLGPMGSGLEGVLTLLLDALHSAMTSGSWSRIKICRNPACLRAFYDRSRNRSGVWCEMAACGNVMKARRFRERQRSLAGARSRSST